MVIVVHVVLSEADERWFLIHLRNQCSDQSLKFKLFSDVFTNLWTSSAHKCQKSFITTESQLFLGCCVSEM